MLDLDKIGGVPVIMNALLKKGILNGDVMTVTSRGWYSQLGAFVKPDRLELGARYGQLDPNRAATNDLVTEVSPFVNVYLRGNDFKVQTDYTLLHTETMDRSLPTPAPTSFDDARLRVQFLVSF